MRVPSSGSVGDSREAILTIVVENDHHQQVRYYVTVRQYVSSGTISGINTQTIYLNADGVTYTNLPYTLPAGYTLTTTITSNGVCAGNGTWYDSVINDGNKLSVKARHADTCQTVGTSLSGYMTTMVACAERQP